MSDQPPPDRASSDPSKQSAWDSVSETELDAALSHAASLAAELSGQVQSADDPAASSRVTTSENSLDDPSTSLDAELEQLEKLVDTAATQVDSEPVPDFMSEFTAPQQTSSPSPSHRSPLAVDEDQTGATASEPSDRTQPAVALAKPGVVGSGMLGVVGGSVNIPTLAVPRPVEPVAPAECERESGPGWATRLFSPLLVPLHGIASVLELIDRPLTRVRGGVRRIAGWVAFVFIIASVVVFVRSAG